MKNIIYNRCYYSLFNFDCLNVIKSYKKAGRGNNTYNDCIIMFDTETSKQKNNEIYTQKVKKNDKYITEIKYNSVKNYIVAWSISIRCYNQNLCTVWGNNPKQLVNMLREIRNKLKGHEIYVYAHNLAYDWVFCRKFLMADFGKPKEQLNTKSHYPVTIKFENGIILKDSLILAQRKLEKWADDLNVEHKKAIGKWDYNKIRNQNEKLTPDEIDYVCNDTLAGVECIDATLSMLKKKIYSIPLTATGIVRNDIQEIGKKHKAKELFKKHAPTYEQYKKLLKIFHGGYCHAGRMYLNWVYEGVKCYDFKSSYPFVMLSEKYPAEKFFRIDDVEADYIVKRSDEYAFMFKLILIAPKIKPDVTMPVLQHSKCVNVITPVLDNGRILTCEYAEIYVTELDLQLILEQYECAKRGLKKWVICTDIECSKKDYLPKWFTDYIYQLFINKESLKGIDDILYMISKGKINSCYGMCVQRSIQDEIAEDYGSGDYYDINCELSPVERVEHEKELYEKYLKKQTKILNYSWGCWVTAYAQYNLFQLGKCCETWLYSDTDSCYGCNWDIEKLNAYNKSCADKLHKRGYEPVINSKGKLSYLGAAEVDGEYTQFKVLGAKRYCCDTGNKLKITVAGVPKKGAEELKGDINNFDTGLIFHGSVTGKLTHSYIYVDDIYEDENGNLIADSIDLTPCDYYLTAIEEVNIDDIFYDDVEVQVYDEE